jgi:5-(carboxyamino)imidazole ribonucleotide mutase
MGETAAVAIVMGSDSDWPTMSPAADVLARFGVDHDVRVVSAHRDPSGMHQFGLDAERAGYEVIIAGAGGAAHLPGMLASLTVLPVIGVPVSRPRLDGLDSLLSIVQMPAGIPVATVAIGGSENAGLLAVRMLARGDERLTRALHEHRHSLVARVDERNARVARHWRAGAEAVV